MFPIELNGETHGVIIETETEWPYFQWKDSFKRCNELGMTMPIPTNDADNTALMNFVINRPVDDADGHIFFIGVYNGVHNNNERKWASLYTNKEITYSKWSDDPEWSEHIWSGEPEPIFDFPSQLKVAYMWQYYDKGDWFDHNLNPNPYGNEHLVCVTVDYEDWEPADMNFGEVLCETGLNECHISSTCIDYTGTTEGIDYQCECSNVTVDGIELKTVHSIVDIKTECRYTHPDLGPDDEVSVLSFDGKPTIYHSTSGLNFLDSVKYCAALGMHLPVPNTEQQFQDLRVIPKNSERAEFWIGFTDSITEKTWLNIYNDEELVMNKWWYKQQKIHSKDHAAMRMSGWDPGFVSVDGSVTKSYLATICMKSDLKITPDFCGMNFHDCSEEAICSNEGHSYSCTCPTIEFNDWVLEPASTSTGKGNDPCHYFHPNNNETRLMKINYGGRETFISLTFIVHPTLYDHAAACQSLGMSMLTPKNEQETNFFDQLRGKAGIKDTPNYKFALGVTRRTDGQWRNIYTNEKLDWNNFHKSPESSGNYRVGQLDFAYGYSYTTYSTYSVSDYWFVQNFHGANLNICIPPEDDESIEIDFCGTGFNDCHEGASCTNGGENGYTCECQPLQIGDVSVEPIDDAGTGKACTYNMPGQDDKTIYPLRVGSSKTVYAFHTSDKDHDFSDAIKYCHQLGFGYKYYFNYMEN